MSCADQEHAEGFDEGAFAGTGNPGNADADRIFGVGQKVVEQLGCLARMIRVATFDQGDGFGQRTDIAFSDSCSNGFNFTQGITCLP